MSTPDRSAAKTDSRESHRLRFIYAADATTPMLTFRLHLQNASRFQPDSPSRKELRRMIEDPNFLDELEEALRDAR